MFEFLQENIGGVCIAIGIIVLAPGAVKLIRAIYNIYKGNNDNKEDK